MTVQNTSYRQDYTGNGVTTAFAVPFYFVDNTHVKVYLTNTATGSAVLQTLNSDYTLTGAGVSTGGTATFTVAPTSGYKVTFIRNVPFTQLTHYVPNDPFPAATHEAALDLLTMQNQQQQETIERSPQLPAPYTTASPLGVPTEGTVLGWLNGAWTWVATASATLQGLLADAASVVNGDALVAVKNTATGGVARTQHLKNAEFVSVTDFGAVGDGTTDDTAAIQAAVNAALKVSFVGPEKSYKVTNTITLRTGQILDFMGATITQATSQKIMFDASGKSDITIQGGKFVGYRTDYVDSPSSQAVGIYCFDAVNLLVTNNRFKWFAYSPLYGENITGLTFTDNTVIGPGLIAAGGCLNPTATPTITRNNTGITAGGSSILIANNRISETGQGLIVAQGSSKVTVADNVIMDVRVEHGMYLDTGLIATTVSGNTVRNAYQNGIKFQWYDSYGITPRGVSITGNTVHTTTTGDGIIVINSSGLTRLAEDVVIADNAISAVAQDGISVRYANKATVSGNTVGTCGRTGIYVLGSTAVLVSGNTVADLQATGIDISVGNTYVTAMGNMVLRSGLNGVGDYTGSLMLLTATSNAVLDGNILIGDPAKSGYGIYITGGDHSTFTVTNNKVFTTLLYGFRADTTVALREYRDNFFNGASVATYNDPLPPVIDSAATLVIPQGVTFATVSGTTNITTITGNGHGGKTVTLAFQGALTVTDGSNLRLAGNFVTTADDTITLACDGATWYEVCRSVN